MSKPLTPAQYAQLLNDFEKKWSQNNNDLTFGERDRLIEQRKAEWSKLTFNFTLRGNIKLISVSHTYNDGRSVTLELPDRDRFPRFLTLNVTPKEIANLRIGDSFFIEASCYGDGYSDDTKVLLMKSLDWLDKLLLKLF